MGVKVEDSKAFAEAAAKVQRNQLLIFSRWCQVMLQLEKSMYENPKQDLNAALVGAGDPVSAGQEAEGPQRSRLRQQVSHL